VGPKRKRKARADPPITHNDPLKGMNGKTGNEKKRKEKKKKKKRICALKFPAPV
jgi:hypothetical protein